MTDMMPKKSYDITKITRLLLEMRENCIPKAGNAYEDPRRAEKYDALNAAIDLINNPSMVEQDGDKPDVCENCTTACAYNSTGTGSCFSYIKQLESRLAQVERERDAALRDMHQLQGALCAYCKNLYRPNDALQGTCSVFGDGYGDSAYSPLFCGGFKWRGVCEENTKEEKK